MNIVILKSKKKNNYFEKPRYHKDLDGMDATRGAFIVPNLNERFDHRSYEAIF